MFEVVIPNRSGLFDGITTEELVARYRANYGLGPEIGIDHVRRHAELEARLTDELIVAPKENRSAIFEQAYTELYRELPWLASVKTSSVSGLRRWTTLMKPKTKVLEIGSGAGALAELLAEKGYECTATEITRERGERFVSGRPNLRWRATDGVHLDQYEEPETYDYILSDQVVEHLHPDDILTHFRTAHKLLKPGGSYIARVPHRRHGPADLSRVFRLKVPAFMHLHEFNYLEFGFIRRECGYSDSLAVITLGPISKKLGWCKASHLFYSHMQLLDRIENSLQRPEYVKRTFRMFSMLLLSTGNVWVQLVR